MKKQLIKDVQNYFTQKLIVGEFKVEKFNSHIASLHIDGYEFTFWIANGGVNFKQYNEYEHINFIQLDISKEDTQSIWETLQPKIEEIKQGEWRKRKLKEFATLKTELGL